MNIGWSGLFSEGPSEQPLNGGHDRTGGGGAPVRHGGDGRRRDGAAGDHPIAALRRQPVSLSALGLGLVLGLGLAVWALGAWLGLGLLAPLVAVIVALAALVVASVGWSERSSAVSAERERDLARRERRLAQQRTALIQTVSHEFRTPLTIIHGVAETLSERQDMMDPQLRPLASALYRAERRLSDMVAVVLAAADALTDPLEQAPVDIEPLILEIAADLEDGAARRVEVTVGDRAEQLVTSRSHCRLLLRLLLDNALRFSDAGQPVNVSASLVDDRATITIRDRGDGVDPAFIERAFEPFTQADNTTLREHGGLGLGLYTARQLARRLGGDVDVRPAEGSGSVAIVTLPQRREADHSDAPR